MVLAAVGLSALVLGSALVSDPAVFVPLVLESSALLFVTLWLLRRVGDVSEQRFLTLVIAAGAAARGFVILIVYSQLNPIFFAPDTGIYAARGGQIAAYWAGVGPDPAMSWQRGYEYMNAVAIRLLGEPQWALVVLNSFAALWTVLVAYVLARACFGRLAAKGTAVLVALFPSMILWSVLNIRDAIATLGVTILVYMAVRLHGRPRLSDVAFLAIGLIALSAIRDYMGVLVLGGLGLGMAASFRPDRVGSTLGIGIVLMLVLVFSLQQGGILGTESLENPLESASRFRSGLQADAGSAFGEGFEIDTPGQALRYLPVGLTFFLFAPFPWAVTSTLQLFTLPEVLLWYSIVPFIVFGFKRSGTRQTRPALLALGVLLVTVTTYALVEGNFGTAYRHGAQVMPLFFVFAAKGLADWWAIRQQRISRQRRGMERARVAAFPGQHRRR